MTCIRLLAIIEATSITGPAKNLLQFAATARSGKVEPRVEVTIASFERGGRESNLFIETARGQGIDTRLIPESGRFDRSVVAALRDLTLNMKPDIVQTHAVKSHFLARCAGIHETLPWVAFHHGYTWPDWRARLYNQFDRWSLPAASQVVTVSRMFAEELQGRGVRPDRIAVLQNSIDPQWGAGTSRESAAGLRAKLGISIQAKVLLIVGRLSEEKDHLTLLRAVQMAKQIWADLYLVIVGDGPSRGVIESSIRELGLENAVRLTGQVPSAEPYYGIADVAVLSSLSEGSPNALLEAMAAGVPAVATRVGGIPEIVEDRDGALLVMPKDIQAMCSAVLELLNDPTLVARIVSRAKEIIKLHHSPEARAQKLCNIYRATLERQS